METMALLTLDTQVINPIWNEYASAQNIGKWLMQTRCKFHKFGISTIFRLPQKMLRPIKHLSLLTNNQEPEISSTNYYIKKKLNAHMRL